MLYSHNNVYNAMYLHVQDLRAEADRERTLGLTRQRAKRRPSFNVWLKRTDHHLWGTR